MNIRYVGDVDINLNRSDIERVLEGDVLSEKVCSFYSKRFFEVNITSSDEKFYCLGGLGEGFYEDSFQGWRLKSPREITQLAFPWGEEVIFINYNFIDIEISIPALSDLVQDKVALEKSNGYVCGMARGSASCHIIDRINLYFSLNQ